jgi:nucleoside 2-deoxyribosyltransferase
MAGLIAEEAKKPENYQRSNLVFMGYPFQPPLPRADYNRVVEELQQKFPVRFWYFLDEVTNDELMRKVWRAILRADLSIFDISGGNPNVAFELGLAVAKERRCFTLLKSGTENPLGRADLGYSERVEYDSAVALGEKLEALAQKSSALKLLKKLADETEYEGVEQVQMHAHLQAVVLRVFRQKQINKTTGTELVGGDERLFYTVLAALRSSDILKKEGDRRGARYVLGDTWAYHDHEVL